jgi:RNA polymerase sigma factor (sigma-70 family)
MNQCDFYTRFGGSGDTMSPQVLAIAKNIRRKYPLPPSMEWCDVLQAAYVGYLDAVARYDPAKGATLSTYLEIRVRGAILDAYRQARGWRDCTPVKPSFMALEEAEDIAEETLALDEAIAALDALTRLPARQQAILQAHYWEDCTKLTISARVGLSPARVGQIVRQAIRRLREVLL